MKNVIFTQKRTSNQKNKPSKFPSLETNITSVALSIFFANLCNKTLWEISSIKNTYTWTKLITKENGQVWLVIP